ncbi:MAG: hypothetical protein J5710_12920 [Treponema sp.]|nr:hypothetical protein [Treponema sp.]
MKGSYEVVVKNRRIQYKFTISRNITILKDDSATGKTTLIDMIQAYQNDSDYSGVSITSTCPCFVLTSNNWELNLSAIHNSLEYSKKKLNDAYLQDNEIKAIIKNVPKIF